MPSVRKLPSGRYQARIAYKVDGRFRQKSFTGDTKREALRKAVSFVPVNKVGTVGDAVTSYIAVKEAVLSPSTVRAYTSMARSIKTRYAAFCALTEVSQEAAQGLVAKMIADGASPKAIKNRIGLISSAVKFSGGQFPRVTLPKVSLRTDFIPSEEMMQRITAEVAGTKMEIPVALGMLGLRRSEICGLSPSDLEGNVLHIHAALVMGPDKAHHKKATKTAQSDRFVMLPDALADKMRGWECDMSPMAVTHAFRKVTARLGISCRFHDLRHFFVSYCHNILRLTDAQIMRLGGWASDSIMKRHYLQSMQDEAAARKVADAFSGMIFGTR